MALVWYESDDTTAATSHDFGTVAAGSSSTAWEIHLWLNKGTPGGSATNVKLQVEAWDGAAYVTSGVAALDSHEYEARVSGYQNPSADPQFVPSTTTVYQRIGTGVTLDLGTIRGDCALEIDVRYSPRLQSGSASSSNTIQLALIYDEQRTVLVTGINDGLGYGILTGVGDPYRSEWVEIPTVTETGTPDDYVQVSRRWWVGLGVSRRYLAEAKQLNQTAADGALGSGEAYYALLSQPYTGGGVTVTKGNGAAAASAEIPSLPAGELPVALVFVDYQAGGTSLIEDADITLLCVDGRFRVSVDTGLDVKVGSGRAFTLASLVEATEYGTVTVTDDATTPVYLQSDGSLSTTSGDMLLADVTASGGSITAVVDRRRYIEPGVEVVRLAARGTETTGTDKAGAAMGRPWNLDRVASIAGTASAGATGNSRIDVNKGGTTLFTNQGGSVESRPTIAAQGTVDPTGYPEVTTGDRGDYLTLDIDAITSGGTQAKNLEAVLYLYPWAEM